MASTELASKTCVPCRGGIPPMTPEEAGEMAARLPRWQLSADSRKIARLFEFPDFVGAMKFVNQVADLAEDQGHHPDFEIHWNRVTLTLFTHKIDGLHENDFVMAARIDELP